MRIVKNRCGEGLLSMGGCNDPIVSSSHGLLCPIQVCPFVPDVGMHSGKEVLITNRVMTTRKRTFDKTTIKRWILTCKHSLLTISNKYVSRV